MRPALQEFILSVLSQTTSERVFLLIALVFCLVLFFLLTLLIESRSFEVVGSGSCRGVVDAVVVVVVEVFVETGNQSDCFAKCEQRLVKVGVTVSVQTTSNSADTTV